MSKFKFSPQTGHIVGTPSLLLAVRVHGNARLIRAWFSRYCCHAALPRVLLAPFPILWASSP